MGLSSKPLHIQVDRSLYQANEPLWLKLLEQGFIIQTIEIDGHPDIYLSPHAMRMTVDMLKQLPSALDLAITGARILRYGPTAKDPTAWKGAKKSHVKAKSPRPRKNSKIKTEAPIGGEHDASQDHQRDGGEVEVPVVETTNREGDHTTHEGSEA